MSTLKRFKNSVNRLFGYRNLIPNPSLSVDSNSNGVADGYVGGKDGVFVLNQNYTIDGGQKIEILTTAGSGGGGAWLQCDVPVNVGDVLTAIVEGYTNNVNLRARIWLVFWNGGSVVRATDFIETNNLSYDTLKLKGIVVPATTTRTELRVGGFCSAGQLGIVGFKNIKLTRK